MHGSGDTFRCPLDLTEAWPLEYMKRFASFIALTLLAAPLAQAGPFVGVTLSANGDALTIDNGQAPFPAPKTEEEQRGYAQPQVSGDGRLVGWVALETACCTSYPLPITLVLLREDRSLVRFEEGLPIWAWKFEKGGTIAFRQRTTHGTSTITYKLIRIRDRKLIGQYECFSEDASSESPRVPNWVWSIADECPLRPAGH
jgi:hypothetical protein